MISFLKRQQCLYNQPKIRNDPPSGIQNWYVGRKNFPRIWMDCWSPFLSCHKYQDKARIYELQVTDDSDPMGCRCFIGHPF